MSQGVQGHIPVVQEKAGMYMGMPTFPLPLDPNSLTLLQLLTYTEPDPSEPRAESLKWGT